MRIVKTGNKVLYLIVAFAVVIVLTLVVQAAGQAAASDWVSTLGAAALTVVAVRIFRMPEEDARAPRAWWRMTGRPTAGYLLGGLNALSAIVALWSVINAASTGEPSAYSKTFSADGAAIEIVSLVVDIAFATLYLASSIRLSLRSTKVASVG